MLNLGNFEENTEYRHLYNTIYHELCDTSVRDAKDEEYPQNLLNKLFDRSEDVVLPPDINGTLEYVLAEMLSPRECAVIHMRYQQKMTLRATGEKLGVTEERVRQIQAKAVARLKHPYRSRSPLAGMKCLSDSFTVKPHTTKVACF